MKPSNLINKLGKDNSIDFNKQLEEIRKLGGNKSCFDCGEKGVTYVVIKMGVFVCSRCSGIHRELGNMVKGIGVSNFTEKEINFLKEVGNDNAKEIWLAKFKGSLPSSTDDKAIKEHINSKYTLKKWFSSTPIEKSKETVQPSFDEEEDIKPDTLKNKKLLKKSVKEEIKETKEIKEEERNSIPVVKAKKLNMNSDKDNKNSNINSNTNNNNNKKNFDQTWKPDFDKGGNNFDTGKNDMFEFPVDDEPITKNDPFGWGSSKPTHQKQSNSMNINQQPQKNNSNDFLSTINFTNMSVNPTTSNTQNNPTSYPQSNDFLEFQPVEEKPQILNQNQNNQKKNNLDDIMNMFNNGNLYGNNTGGGNMNQGIGGGMNHGMGGNMGMGAYGMNNLNNIGNIGYGGNMGMNNLGGGGMGIGIPPNNYGGSNINFNINNNLYNPYPINNLGPNSQNPQLMMMFNNVVPDIRTVQNDLYSLNLGSQNTQPEKKVEAKSEKVLF